MTTTQKVIKYCALALAIFLIGTLFYGVSHFFLTISSFNEKEDLTQNLETIMEFNDVNITKLDIDVKTSHLIIKKNNKFKLETNNKKVEYQNDNNVLTIKDNSKVLKNNSKSQIVLYLPEENFEEAKISSGAGIVDIEFLTTDELFFDFGAGKATINDLTVNKYTMVQGGTGKLEINNSELTGLDLDMGVGEAIINAKLVGSSTFDAGVGNLEINLNGSKEDYTINSSNGIGAITIDGMAQADGSTYGSGRNIISVSGGIGKISINFTELTESNNER